MNSDKNSKKKQDAGLWERKVSCPELPEMKRQMRHSFYLNVILIVLVIVLAVMLGHAKRDIKKLEKQAAQPRPEVTAATEQVRPAPTEAPTQAPTEAPPATEPEVAAEPLPDPGVKHPGVTLLNSAPPMEEDFISWLSRVEVPVLVDIRSTNCPPCDKAAPVIEAIAEDNDGQLVVPCINVDEADSAIWQGFDVQIAPTFLMCRNGEIVDRLDGYRDVPQDLYDLVEGAFY